MSVTLVEVKKMLKEMFLEYRKEMETMLKQQQQIFIEILRANTKIINERLDKVEENSKESANKIKIIVKDIEDIKLSLNFHDEVFGKKIATIHKQNNDRVEKENITTQNINEKLRKFEDRLRRNNLRIEGLPESVKETWNETEDKVKLFLVNKLGLNGIEVERAHRTGARKEGSSRTVIMKLLRYNDKTKILKESYRLKGTNIYLNEGFSHETVNIRKRLLAEVKERRDNGENVGLSIEELSCFINASQNTFSALTLNIRSMSKNFENFKEMLKDISHEFTVICLLETWCKDENTINSNFQLKGYKALHQTRSRENYCGNTKKTWGVIKKVTGKKKDATKVFPQYLKTDENDTVANKAIDIAEKFNNYFIKIGEKLANKITRGKKCYKLYLEKKASVMNELEITPDELKNAFNTLQENKSPGLDNISVNVVKNVYNVIEYPLLHICNLSLKNGVFPDQLKLAKVVPIFKSGDNSIASNYRPISILPCISKILERIMHNRLNNYLVNHHLLNSNQYGFQKHHSTEHAVGKLVNEILNGNNNLKWFRSYLNNRKQALSYNNTVTRLEDITCGVPQGSILGPLLFLVYINDIYLSSNILNFVLFADDTQVFFSHTNISLLFNTVNQELENLNEWFKANKLSLNVEKTTSATATLSGQVLILQS
nr:uncharacterized protein LOC124819147 [Hydra vulgaris]